MYSFRGRSKIDLSDVLVAEAYLIEAIGRGWAEADPLSGEATSDKVAMTGELEVALAARLVGGWSWIRRLPLPAETPH